MGKRLSNTQEVYHVWANQTQTEGYCGNCSFEGVRAYSYRAVIGIIVTNEKGEKAFLLSNRNYSVTTSKHQGYAYRSIPFPSSQNIFTTELELPRYDAPNREFYNAVLEGYWKEIVDLYSKAKRARQNKERLFEQCRNLKEMANRFADFFGLDRDLFEDNYTTLDEEIEAAKAITAKYDAIREEKYREQREREEIARQERVKEELARLEAWKEGATGYHYFHYLKTDYLRISPSDNTIVETTRGARVPLTEVQRFAPIILRKMKHFKTLPILHEYHPIKENICLGGYQVRGFDAENNLIVGCHRFSQEEIERFAKVIGVGEEK